MRVDELENTKRRLEIENTGLRGRLKPSDARDERVATLARKITALLQHPQQNVSEIYKNGGRDRHLAEPETKSRKPIVSSPAVGDPTAWKAMGAGPGAFVMLNQSRGRNVSAKFTEESKFLRRCGRPMRLPGEALRRARAGTFDPDLVPRLPHGPRRNHATGRNAMKVRAMLDHACGNGRHTLAERGLDLYQTPAPATEALLRVERLPDTIWKSAAGRGGIANVLRAHGHAVICNDIADYGYPLHFQRDFLTGRRCRRDAMHRHEPAVPRDRALHRPRAEASPLVVMLARLAFYESARRTPILENAASLASTASEKLPMLHRDGWEARKAKSGMAFGWMVWSRGHTGPTKIDRIRWER